MDVLKYKTDPQWVDLAIANFGIVLEDHAHCEKKAAAASMALVNAYPDHSELVHKCTRLAMEELRHFEQVHKLLLERGLKLQHDLGDPYAKALQKCARGHQDHRRMDRLLVASIIEARSWERLDLLAQHLTDDSLKKFYAALATAEAGHHRLFVELACLYDDKNEVLKRLDSLADQEAEILKSLPVRASIH